MKVQTNALPVAVIGAGPVGLAAAAHLLLRGQKPLIFEDGSSVAANLASYRQVRLFSPWRFNLDQASVTLLEPTGWIKPDLEGLPTAGEMIDQYLQPLAQLPAIAEALHFEHRVVAISRQGYDKVKTKGRDDAPFVLRVQTPDGEKEYQASAVIDASGTWSQANPLGANGVPALGEQRNAAHITYGMPDILGAERQRFAGKRVLVVGTGHSAAGNLLALAQLAEQVPGTTLLWAIRGNHVAKVFGGGSADGLPARGQLGSRLKALKESGQLSLYRNFQIREIRSQEHGIEVIGEVHQGETPLISGIDEIIGATGARPDLSLSRELRVRYDPWLESTDALAPLIDPNVHSCGTVRPHGHRELAHPETGYYAVGAKSYGRAPNFLMATGYEQVRSVVAALTGDLAAADHVQLILPKTGVCSTQPVYELPEKDANAGCCGGAAPTGSNACCVLDADEKAKGNAGCGCSTQEGTQASTPTAIPAPVKAKSSCCN
ncbi:NAD(P)-binding domain-containing protein [Undibacterium sp. CY18W]|uniref:NAD(P)-binding domain-containing protein n=1 Tax=Undibacterium hunanense TaxID=2762292 RepID=A0ABR6ZTM0_9BURK|nr:NAD(P)-binding domain-containing protein [Undibacterium hunanense]MBC3919221.1 NAD(P)-binding domain-containing protein [Undibacterium hunanense]